MGQNGGLTARELMGLIEAAGFQFLKDKGGWACYDTDDRREVRGSRNPRLGESVWLASKLVPL
jgi:hypothetical protein